MMWRVWKALQHPVYDYPVFMRVIDDIYDDTARLSRITQNIFLKGQIWLWPLLFIIDMRLICLMVFSSTISGTILALRISNRIVSEQQRRTYDLLCLTPGGTIHTLWAICTGCLHREKAFEILNSLESWVVRFGMFIPFVISSQLFLQRYLGMKGDITLTWGLGFIALAYIDHTQATVFSCLSGMLSAHYSSNIDKRLWAELLFLGFQIWTYLSTLIFGLFVLPSICQLLNHIGIDREISQMMLTVACFYLLREAMITLCWRRLMAVTNTSRTEIDLLLIPNISYPQSKLHDDAQTVARA